MRLSVSNIAWSADCSAEVLKKLAMQKVDGIEVAPTAQWNSWEYITKRKISEFRAQLVDLGFVVPAIQSLTYGTSFTSIFDREQHSALLAHMRTCAQIAELLGAKVMVFGSPKLRRLNGFPFSECYASAAMLFGQIGDICREHGCILGIENNPEEYGCDFLRTVGEVSEFVEQLGNKGVGVHVDSAAIFLADNDIADSIGRAGDICHFHISEPFLGSVAGGVVNHSAMVKSLRAKHYSRWVSIEMRQPDRIESIFDSVSFVTSLLESVE